MEMPTIYHPKGFVIEIDQQDLERLGNRKITVHLGRCIITVNDKLTQLGRFIMNPNDREVVDHIDGNPMNNKRCNLRICSQKNNCWNQRKRKVKTQSHYKGVSLSRYGFRSQIKKDYKYIHIGNFKTEREAAIAYNIYAKNLFGEYALINDLDELKEEVEAVKSKLANPKKRTGTSKYSGVSFDPKRGVYQAYVNFNKKRISIGRFANEIDAALSVNNTIERFKIPKKKNVICH